jgi:hypothetical protein
MGVRNTLKAVTAFLAVQVGPAFAETPSKNTESMTIGVVVFMLGILAGAGVAMWVMPPP